MSDLALVKAEDLSLVESNSLNDGQLKHLLKKTPKQYLKKRPAKGGGEWTYVTGGYVRKVLNLMFGWDWDFEILDEKIFTESGEVVVKGRLTCRTNGRTIIKTQYGNKDIAFKAQDVLDENGKPVYYTDKYGKQKKKRQPSTIPLSIGNDLKAAATDALKKCAAEIGIAADVYNAEDFREVKVQDELGELKELFEWVGMDIDFRLKEQIQGVIDRKEKSSYAKCIRTLKEIRDNE